MFGQKKKEAEKPKEEEKKPAKRAKKISKSSARGDSVTRGDDAASDCDDSAMNIQTEECDETNDLPDFSIEIVKTTRLFSPDKKTKQQVQGQYMKQTMSSSLKMVEIKEDKGAAEAQAIYQGGAAGGIKVASKDEVKESVGLNNKSEKRINLFKKR